MKVEINFILAQRDRLKTYQSERPCPRHGTVQRYTSTRGCIECNRENSSKAYDERTGLIRRVTLQAHKDDVELIETFAAQLLGARKCVK